MTLRLDPAALSAARLRNGAEKALDEIVTQLTERPDGLHAAIHAARKTLKRLRAFHRLVARRDRAFFARQNARLRDAAQGLAETRETAALAETAEWLATQARSPEEIALLARISKALAARRDALDDSALETPIAGAIAACRAAKEELAGLDLPGGRRKMGRLVAHGWRHALRRARRTLSPLTVDAEGEGFHELRKSAQTLNAYLMLLRPLWPEAMTARQEMLKPLIETLGRENDIAGLIDLMGREPRHFGEPIEQVVLHRLLGKRRQALRLAALQQAAKVFDADPDEDARRIEILWKALAD